MLRTKGAQLRREVLISYQTNDVLDLESMEADPCQSLVVYLLEHSEPTVTQLDIPCSHRLMLIGS